VKYEYWEEYGYPFLYEDLKLLYNYLKYQHIPYKEIELMEVVRKIGKIVEAHELAKRDN
jgi:uncharacterized HAD superfamily protein